METATTADLCIRVVGPIRSRWKPSFKSEFIGKSPEFVTNRDSRGRARIQAGAHLRCMTRLYSTRHGERSGQ
jgi:hypothetical protein